MRKQVWLRKTFPESFIAKSEDEMPRPDHLYIDMNDVLHATLRKTRRLLASDNKKRNEVFFSHLFQEIDAILAKYKPKSSVMLSVDGPGPVAKLAEQVCLRIKF